MAPIISDLALILICAGVMTLVFKKLKQPLVLGYIVAGFICSPHFIFAPSVVDIADIHVWSDIGVIFLLFALGLEFSFKKIVKVGGTAVIAAICIIFSMMLVGMFMGWCFGWQQMDCLYLGGMLAMSSTTIIYKAFDDLGLRQQRFASLVLSILILEDILAIVLMVMLSTVAVSQKFEGGEMFYSILKLMFFLMLWILVGIYVIPTLLKRYKPFMSAETLLIVSLALCFGMVVAADAVGFSPAFGAFIMGSILAETLEAESISRVVEPVKNLFGAIFFVSVGMMVDPAMIVNYIWPIVALVLAILLGQTILGSGGVLLSGQPLKVAMQCGFSLTQIGEFAFIIASLGVSLKVTSDFLYPIVVAVSVITTFLTPYMIRMAVPAYNVVSRLLPRRVQTFLDRYANGSRTANDASHWRKYILTVGRTVVIYLVVCDAIILLANNLLLPFVQAHLPKPWDAIVCAAVTILCMAPFLRSLVLRRMRNDTFELLWSNRRNRLPLIFVQNLRIVLGVALVYFVIYQLFQTSIALAIAIAVLLVCVIMVSHTLNRQGTDIEKKFMNNWNVREQEQDNKKPAYAHTLLSRDMHLSEMTIPAQSPWVGKTLRELNLTALYGIHIVSITRGNKRINIPNADACLYPFDQVQTIGTDSQLTAFAQAIDQMASTPKDTFHEMQLCQIELVAQSPFVGKTLRQCAFMQRFHCLLAGIEEANGNFYMPSPDEPLAAGMILWMVGEPEHLKQILP